LRELTKWSASRWRDSRGSTIARASETDTWRDSTASISWSSPEANHREVVLNERAETLPIGNDWMATSAPDVDPQSQ
jgi:hypothetical protein